MKYSMSCILFLFLAGTVNLTFLEKVNAAGTSIELDHQEWSFDGFFGTFDRQQLQRGFQVYREVCSSCHGINYIAFRNLTDLGYDADQIKFLASEYTIEECCDDQGEFGS